MALLRRERRHQVAHRRHAPRHAVEELLQGSGVVREHVAVALHESVEVDLLAAVPRLDQVVQVREHVLEPLHVLGRGAAETLRDIAEVGAEHLLAEVVHQLVEIALRLRVDESVVGELLELARQVGRERVEEALPHTGVVARLELER